MKIYATNKRLSGTTSLPQSLRIALASIGFLATILAMLIVPAMMATRTTDLNKIIDKLDLSSRPNPVFYNAIGTPEVRLDSPMARNILQDLEHRFTLEITTTKTREDAQKIVKSLHKEGIEVFSRKIKGENGNYYSIRRGIFRTRRKADLAAEELKRDSKLSSKVIKIN